MSFVRSTLLLMIMIPVLLQAVIAQAGREKMAGVILEKSGLEMQISQIPEIVAVQYDHELDNLHLREAAEIRSILLNEFSSDKIYRDMAGYLKENLKEDEASQLINFFDSDLVTRMTGLEVEASNPAAMNDMQTYLNQIENDPDARERINLMIEFDHSLDGTSFTVELLSQLYVNMIRTITPAIPEADPPTIDELEQYRSDMYDSIYVPYRQVTVGFYLYAYRDVSTNDILRYKSFFDSSTGYWYNQLVKSMVTNAISNAGDRASKRVVQLVNNITE